MCNSCTFGSCHVWKEEPQQHSRTAIRPIGAVRAADSPHQTTAGPSSMSLTNSRSSSRSARLPPHDNSFGLETVMDVVYPAGRLHVERDRVELLGVTHERVDQFPLAAADADAVVRARTMSTDAFGWSSSKAWARCSKHSSSSIHTISDSSLDQWMHHEPTGVWAFSLPSKWNAFSGLYIFT